MSINCQYCALLSSLLHRWKLRFIRSDFHGQLPQPYSPHRNATWVVPDHMNDMNQEEPSRYVSD